MSRTPSLLALSMLALPTVGSAQEASFHGLGDLSGGTFSSVALGVSDDASVVVGTSNGPNGLEAFRWTEATGMVGLGDIAGGLVVSHGHAVSADGAIVIGTSEASEGPEAFRWTAGGGMESLGVLAPNPFSHSSGGHGISADGLIIVGESTNGNQDIEAFRWTSSGGMVGLGDLPGGFVDSRALDVSASGSVVVGLGRNADDHIEAARWVGGVVFALGDLPGQHVESQAYGVSADGNVVVGVGLAETSRHAFRWTATEGMVDINGGPFTLTIARATSGDGSIVIGEGQTPGGQRAFIWTAADGMRDLRSVLISDYGLDLTGWTLRQAHDISPDGLSIVGVGTNPQGQVEAWRVLLPRVAVVAPTAGALVIGGERFPIRWAAPSSIALVDLLLLPDTLGSAAVTIEVGVTASDMAFLWTVPDTLFSRSARIVVRDFLDASTADTSGYFRIKPYRLTRLTADETRYDRFRPDRHGWPYGNTTALLFPPDWQALSQFNYRVGPDPFTQSEYDRDFPEPPINARPEVFSDWPAYVRAYGTDEAYHLIIPFVEGYYRAAFTASWGAFHGGRGHNGSCAGMAVSSLLAFGHREAFGARYPFVGPVDRLITIGMSPPVREMVNTLYSYWGGTAQRAHRDAIGSETRTPRQTLADLKARFVSDSRAEDSYLYIASPIEGGGAHAVVPYGLRRDPSGVGRWRVLVYDPNAPTDSTRAVLLDSLANQWFYAGGLNWGGSTRMYLMDPVPNYLTETGFPGLVPLDAPPAAGPASLYVAATPGANVRVASAAGEVGYAAGTVFNTLPGAAPDVPPVGGPTPPIGYGVPPGAYAVTMAAFPDSAVAAYVFSPGAVYAYGRADADTTHTDRLTYDPAAGIGGGLSAASADAGVTKTVALRVVLTPTAGLERTLDAADLGLVGADSVAFAAIDDAAGPRLRLANGGSAKTYTLRLREADAAGEARFRHVAVPLPGGATHVVRPVWATLGSAAVEVDVDLNGDGTPEEVLVLENQPVAAEPGSPPTGSPGALALHGPTPNPATGHATIRYDLPAAGAVRLAVYDALGRQVAVLVDGELPAGAHEAMLDAGTLAPGLYVVRLTAGAGMWARTLTISR